MEEKKLTDEELNDFISRVVVQLEPKLTQQVISLILELSEYRNKIEKGTLKEIPEGAVVIEKSEYDKLRLLADECIDWRRKNCNINEICKEFTDKGVQNGN